MDLETVELIMAVEEEFIIEIPDDRAERIVSIGELRNVVMAELQRFDRGSVGPDTTLVEDLGLS